jgi:hypothetical protein
MTLNSREEEYCVIFLRFFHSLSLDHSFSLSQVPIKQTTKSLTQLRDGKKLALDVQLII